MRSSPKLDRGRPRPPTSRRGKASYTRPHAVPLVDFFICRCSVSQAISAAQDSPVGPPANTPQRAVPQYQVEVLIFTHRDFDPNEEQFALEERREPSPDQSLRSLDTLDDGVEFDADAPVSLERLRRRRMPRPPVEPDASAVSEAAAVPENEFRFRVLRPEELQLTSQYRVLARLPAYHPLVHGGWVQLGLPDTATVPVDEPMPMSPEQFGQYIRDDIQRWTVLAKARKIQLDG